MATSTVGADDRWTRFVQIALAVNASLVALGGVLMVVGLAPHAAEHASWARRAGVEHVAAAAMMVFASIRVRQDASIVWLPLAYVACNLFASVCDVAVTGDPDMMGGLPIEAASTAIYVSFLATRRRARGAAE